MTGPFELRSFIVLLGCMIGLTLFERLVGKRIYVGIFLKLQTLPPLVPLRSWSISGERLFFLLAAYSAVVTVSLVGGGAIVSVIVAILSGKTIDASTLKFYLFVSGLVGILFAGFARISSIDKRTGYGEGFINSLYRQAFITVSGLVLFSYSMSAMVASQPDLLEPLSRAAREFMDEWYLGGVTTIMILTLFACEIVVTIPETIPER